MTAIRRFRDAKGVRRVQLLEEADVPQHHGQQALLQGRAPARRHEGLRRHAGAYVVSFCSPDFRGCLSSIFMAIVAATVAAG